MAHGHHHGHSHDHGHPHAPKRLRLAFILNLAFTLVEMLGAWWTHSVAVLGGALHDLGDSLVLGAAWYLQHVAARGRDDRYSYGYGRYGMLGGWSASIVLGVGSLVIIVVTLPRFFEPVEVHPQGMMIIAGFGLLMNLLAMLTLRREGSLNERTARLHLLEDVLSWAAVLIGGAILRFTGLAWIDPLLSIAIACFILYNAFRMLREGTGILMQRLPGDVDMDVVRDALLELPYVIDVHDQHAWTLDGHYTVLTVHLVVDTAVPEGMVEVKQRARAVLDRLGIQHATIEIETPKEVCALQHH